MGEIVDKMRKYHLPCDAIHLDIDYMDGYRVFTWRTDTYDDPKKFINKLHKLGLHIITIIDPGVKKMNLIRFIKKDLKKVILSRRQMVKFMLIRFGLGMRFILILVVKQLENGGQKIVSS